MSKFENLKTGVVVSVSDEKDHRFTNGWKPEGAASRSETPDESWKAPELKAYAKENGIDLGSATRKDDILAALAAAATSDEEIDEDDSEES